jgi:hypothetical protein
LGAALLAVALGVGVPHGAFAGDNAARTPKSPNIPDDLGARWEKWVMAIPLAKNPLFDDTGANCHVAQDDDLWFLAGTFKNLVESGIVVGRATRHCNVPQGAKIAFPIFNAMAFDTPNLCGQGASVTIEELRAGAAEWVSSGTNVRAVLDGQEVPKKRLVSPLYTFRLPADNLWGPSCGTSPLPAGKYRNAVDDGFYAVLPPLTRGGHTLNIHAETPTFLLDVTYYLNVVDD